jgi:hypothetical protein
MTLQEALNADGCERLRDFYNVGPVQRASVESFIEALAQQGEPVAYCYVQKSTSVDVLTFDDAPNDAVEGTLFPLYPAPQPAQQPVAFYDFQKHGFRWADNTVVGQVPVAVMVEPMALYAAPAPQPGHIVGVDKMVSQPVSPLSDDEILTIAHRKATRYTCTAHSNEATYGFSVTHLIDFANSIMEVK